MLVLSDEQDKAITAALDYVANFDPAMPRHFLLAGMAGTGKTTALSTLIERCGFKPTRIALLAPTGKAASVLNRKQSDVLAMTVHSFLYGVPHDKLNALLKLCDAVEAELGLEDLDPNVASGLKTKREELMKGIKELASSSANNLVFSPRPADEIRPHYDLIICDEASMVGAPMMGDLMAVKIPTIFVGDGNQLPPVGVNSPFNFSRADAKLTTVVRQAKDSGILALSRTVLQKGRLPKRGEVQEYPDVSFSRHTNVLRFIDEDKDLPQFISYFHDVRHRANLIIRQHSHLADKVPKDLNYLPFEGETVVVDANIPTDRISRGDTMKVVSVERPDSPAEGYDRYVLDWHMIRFVELEDMYGATHVLRANLNDMMLSMDHPKAIDTRKATPAQLRLYQSLVKETIPLMFPYAITCHKAQGSEYPHVVLFNDKPRSNYKEFLYTGITRASKKLVVAGHEL